MNFSLDIEDELMDYTMSGETGDLYSFNKTNSTDNCTNDYCVSDADYLELMENYIFPTTYEWILISFHCVVFIVGLVGNALVCVAVYRNHSMRTVTNYFIVNLAVADFMVILFCLPPTVLWDVTETWFMGTALCKVVLYFQTVSVAVSVLTLTFISVDRWYAICFPLRFKSTTNRAKTAIIIIWLIALSGDIPELIVLRTRRVKELKVETLFFTQCLPSWDHESEKIYTAFKVILLYICPLLFMSVAYCQIVRVLWSSANIPGHAESNKYKPYHNNGVTGGRRNPLTSSANTTTEAQLRSRRKAAKMLVAVVAMFAVCYFPVHLLSVLSIVMELPQNSSMVIFSMLSHWLCYANSAVNPVIYNFMSGKFRREFKRAICQCHRTDNQYYTNHTQSEYPLHTRTGTVMSRTESSRYQRGQVQIPLQTMPPRTVWRSVSTSSKGAPNNMLNSQL